MAYGNMITQRTAVGAHPVRTSSFHSSYYLESPEEEICLRSHSLLLFISLNTVGTTWSTPKKAFPLAYIFLKLYPIAFLPFPDQLNQRKAFILCLPLFPIPIPQLLLSPFKPSPLQTPVISEGSLQRPICSPHLPNDFVTHSTVFYHLLL